MLRLAVATRAETFERVRDPLSERGIEVRHLRTDERTVPLAEPWPDSFDVGFVFPPRPMEGGVADALLGIPWVNDREAVLTSRNKAGVLAALGRAGVPVPETTMVSNPAGDAAVEEALSDAAFPVVVKPNSTTRGVGVAKASDLDSALGVVDYLNLLHEYPATGDRSYLIQEYLPDARDYRAMVVDGECVGAVERRLPDDALVEGRWKHNVHRGASATAVDLPRRHRRLAERTADVLDVPYLGVDLLESGGRVVVNETNARPTVDAATKYDPDFYDRLAALVRRQVD
ncbi:ATP-grasp domain-containing protein [Halegenticoccus soli]|uniref:ATP-grasp domain-containing protein n=1 Tax=Halegenticoccus soli TaxID=1985678 RepID=UPI000C6DF8B2|nr:RimK family alpha-L-glutamate ligase [Halegenticoccus soli]